MEVAVKDELLTAFVQKIFNEKYPEGINHDVDEIDNNPENKDLDKTELKGTVSIKSVESVVLDNENLEVTFGITGSFKGTMILTFKNYILQFNPETCPIDTKLKSIKCKLVKNENNSFDLEIIEIIDHITFYRYHRPVSLLNPKQDVLEDITENIIIAVNKKLKDKIKI